MWLAFDIAVTAKKKHSLTYPSHHHPYCLLGTFFILSAQKQHKNEPCCNKKKALIRYPMVNR